MITRKEEWGILIYLQTTAEWKKVYDQDVNVYSENLLNFLQFQKPIGNGLATFFRF